MPNTRSILIVDDDLDGAIALAKLLQLNHYITALAHAFNEALRLCETRNFDLLICDVQLGDGNGLALLETLRRRCEFAKGIVLSGWADQMTRKRAVQLGYAAFLAKPVDFKTLADTVRNVLDGPSRLDALSEGQYGF